MTECSLLLSFAHSLLLLPLTVRKKSAWDLHLIAVQDSSTLLTLSTHTTRGFSDLDSDRGLGDEAYRPSKTAFSDQEMEMRTGAFR